MEKHIPVSEEWVKKEAVFANYVINHVLHLDSDKGYFPIPADMQLKVENQKITRVRYAPEQKRNILDLDKVLKSAETREEDLPLKRSPSKMNTIRGKSAKPVFVVVVLCNVRIIIEYHSSKFAWKVIKTRFLTAKCFSFKFD